MTSQSAPSLSDSRIAELLEPYLSGATAPSGLIAALGSYLELLLRWNSRTNLTSIRDPETIVQRHFGESLFAGLCLKPYLKPGDTLLDFGSGAGFPGVPIQLLIPEVRVTLAESQGKKSAFLDEVVRSLKLQTEVWPQRVEMLPQGRCFNAVTLRAVDRMDEAVAAARHRVGRGGHLVVLMTDAAVPVELGPATISESFPIPGLRAGRVLMRQVN